MNGLDEMFKTVGEVVDTLDEEYYLMGEKKSFVSDSEVNWNDQLQTSQQQLQSFKQGKILESDNVNTFIYC